MTWYPDTCGCAIEVIDWETVTGKTLVACPYHQGLVDDAHFAVVYLKENKAKNDALALIAKAAPDLFFTAQHAADANRSRLLAAGPPTQRYVDHLAVLTDADVEEALRDLSLPVTGAGQPAPGIKAAYTFEVKAAGEPRALKLDVPTLTAPEKATLEAELTKAALPVPVAVKK